MGQVSFYSDVIPVAGPPREVLNEQIEAADRTLTFCSATIGNPHCVVLCDDPAPALASQVARHKLARQLGPIIEVDPRFPNRTNVQFMQVLDRKTIRIEIWERGAGYTLASGSSSCAAAAVAVKLGLCDQPVTVHMPGGQLKIQLSDDFVATMTGPVTRVCHGVISTEILEQV